jgi:hypothetical protein
VVMLDGILQSISFNSSRCRGFFRWMKLNSFSKERGPNSFYFNMIDLRWERLSRPSRMQLKFSSLIPLLAKTIPLIRFLFPLNESLKL